MSNFEKKYGITARDMTIRNAQDAARKWAEVEANSQARIKPGKLDERGMVYPAK